jgi:hypothetical protein
VLAPIDECLPSFLPSLEHAP